MSQYFGGKARIGKHLAAFINHCNPATYCEPFCGMYSVGSKVKAGVKIASDLHLDLILMLRAVQRGWEPPSELTEERYVALKGAVPSALRGFAGFACSFGGKFFGGYARNGVRNYADVGRRSLLRLKPLIQDTEFLHQSYREAPESNITYCDPPYGGTTGFSTGSFDTAEFWQWCRDRRGAVLVSEYTAPEDFEVVWSRDVRTDMRTNSNGREKRVEKLFLAPC